ncbi:MAG: molybdopterin-dependent oxidoreductase [Candidatus Latescibacterota bacterium]|nr:MAG: molybdopterin-dependent oxidoreductase [Candidatus Latescibacterota bacterium]
MSRHHERVGRRAPRVDGPGLVAGTAQFTDDFAIRGMMHAKILFSPHAHARIRRIDATRARALDGVACVLTHRDVPRIAYTTAGQNHPEPSPYDVFLLDSKVRFVGDRVAVVAAESLAIAEKALALIEVEYEVLPAVFDPAQALTPGAPIIHDEPDCEHVFDATRNLAAHVEVETGEPDAGFARAARVFEATYSVPQVQQCAIEPHVSITYLDEQGRLVVRTSTQVPFHSRRIVARVNQMRPGRLRVIKPRVGGGFGGKQEILNEELCAALTLRTRRPVRLEYTREEEFRSSRSRHAQTLTLRTGVDAEARIVANELRVVANTGAYGTHALTVQTCTGSKTLPLYRCPNLRFVADVVYTNLPVAGAFRGYGGPQGYFALESHIDEMALGLGLDPLEFRRRNMIREGDPDPLAVALGEGKQGVPRTVHSCGLAQCVEDGAAAIGWPQRRGGVFELQDPSAISGGRPQRRRGIGMAIAMHGTSIPGDDMGAAHIKVNEDGTFNLACGATDIGTGSDTVLAQIAAEVLGVDTEHVVIHSSDTDTTPFDVGAYASSTTYISGRAVQRAAEAVRTQLLDVASDLLREAAVDLRGGHACAASGKRVAIADVARESLYGGRKSQIQGTASKLSDDSPPPFAATFAEVEVDLQTGKIDVLHLVQVVDCGVAINPMQAEAQVEGGSAQALGYALCEEMLYDEAGRLSNASFSTYRIPTALDMPRMTTRLVHTFEPSGPFGAKSVAEIPLDGPAPAIANAVRDATGVRLRAIPMTPERVWRALQEHATRAKQQAAPASD